MVEHKRKIVKYLERSDTAQASEIARLLGVTRQTAHRYLRQLVKEGTLSVEGGGRSTSYRKTPEYRVWKLATAGLEEDRAWARILAAESWISNLRENVREALEYVFTEVVNNAIEHSGAPQVQIALFAHEGRIVLEVQDLGVGVFSKVRHHLGLASELEALQEISKGKVTTDPERHTGEGLFFASRVVERFELISGGLRWIVDNEVDDVAVGTCEKAFEGTRVLVELIPDAEREVAGVFAEYTDDFEFSKTRTLIRLFELGTAFVSRSEAKRLVRGLDRFREVVLDFRGVELVGQGFADEVFRVWSRNHPDVILTPIQMNEAVEFMVERARRGQRAFGSPHD